MIYHKIHFCDLCGLHELLMCFFKDLASENNLPQDSPLWSLWPSWTVWMYFFKYLASANDAFFQICCFRKGLTTIFTLVVFVAFMNYVDVFFQISCLENDLLQESYLWSLWPSWTVWKCIFKWSALENNLPHDSQL